MTTTLPALQPDSYKSNAEYYQSFGYRFEEHKIMTEDGYILSAWRIPGEITEPMNKIRNKPPVILQHGLLDNSGTWTVNYFNKTLPYSLLKEGFDVWITNSRGNFNSYEHRDPMDYSVFSMGGKYWNFTLDNMGRFDVPANIDYILDYTNSKKVSYIGHSQGTIQFFIANSISDIASKIDIFVGLGPVLYVRHPTSPLVTLGRALHIFEFLNYLHISNILVWPTIVNTQITSIANRFRYTLWRFIQLIVGVSEEIMMDIDRMAVLGRHEPGGTSSENMVHWIQMMNSGNFQRFDYGQEENINVYGQPTPPLYSVENLRQNVRNLNMLLLRGENDALSDKEDFQELINELSEKIGNISFNHIFFI